MADTAGYTNVGLGDLVIGKARLSGASILLGGRATKSVPCQARLIAARVLSARTASAAVGAVATDQAEIHAALRW